MTPPSPASVAAAKEIWERLLNERVEGSDMKYILSGEPDAELDYDEPAILNLLALALDAAHREGAEAEKLCRVCLVTPMECPVCVGYKRIDAARRDGEHEHKQLLAVEALLIDMPNGSVVEGIKLALKRVEQETWAAAAKRWDEAASVCRTEKVETDSPQYWAREGAYRAYKSVAAGCRAAAGSTEGAHV